MVVTRFSEVGHENLYEYDGRQYVCLASLIAIDREETANQLYLHSETMFFCSCCNCSLKKFVDHFAKCVGCRRAQKKLKFNFERVKRKNVK